MKCTKSFYLITATVALLTSVAAAANFEISRLSPFRAYSGAEHTSRGVSQFLAGNLIKRTLPLRLWNPTPVTMLSVVFAYHSTQVSNLGNDIDPEIFLGCGSWELSPHASLRIKEETLNDAVGNGGDERLYVEVLTIPKTPVRISPFSPPLYQCNGCGVRGGNGEAETLHLLDSQLWNLPDDDAAPGQRQIALDCLCDIAVNEIGDRFAYASWGIICEP